MNAQARDLPDSDTTGRDVNIETAKLPSQMDGSVRLRSQIRELRKEALQSADNAEFAGRQSFAESAGVPNATRAPVWSYSALAEWEGTVIEVGTESFSATLLQIPRGTQISSASTSRLQKPTYLEQTELPIDDIRAADRDLLKPGALFRMVIGYLISPTGTRRRSLTVVFRRLPQWREPDLQRSRKVAEDEQAVFDSIPRP